MPSLCPATRATDQKGPHGGTVGWATIRKERAFLGPRSSQLRGTLWLLGHAHRARRRRRCQPAGSTCTFIRRRHCGQNRGGSSARAAAQAAWVAGRPRPARRSGRRTGSPRSWAGHSVAERALTGIDSSSSSARSSRGRPAQRGEVVADDDGVDAAEQAVAGAEVTQRDLPPAGVAQDRARQGQPERGDGPQRVLARRAPPGRRSGVPGRGLRKFSGTSCGLEFGRAGRRTRPAGRRSRRDRGCRRSRPPCRRRAPSAACPSAPARCGW